LRAVLDAEEGVRVVKEFPETLESTIP
jgi:hypothetical protein